MKFEHKSGLGVISRDGSWVYPLASLDMDYKTMQELIENISESEKQLLEYVSGQDPYKVRGAAPIGEVSLLAPIPHPRQDVICLGINYMAHAEESARFKKEAFDGERPIAIYFFQAGKPCHGSRGRHPKPQGYCNGPGLRGGTGSHHRPRGIPCRVTDVKDYIFGYTIINDVSARTLQTRHKQWYFGKGLDGFLPMGPCIATVDELSYPPKVQVQSRVNGELRQDSNTELLIFDITILSANCPGYDLKAGNHYCHRTPAGGGHMGFNPPKFLVPGDVVECTIEGIGTIANKVTD